MKGNVVNIMNSLIVLVPWAIIPIRKFDWALVTPNAERIILGFAIFMMIGGIFTIVTYPKGRKNNYSRICLVINSLYLLFGLFAIGTILLK